jgi:hypothetical protein
MNYCKQYRPSWTKRLNTYCEISCPDSWSLFVLSWTYSSLFVQLSLHSEDLRLELNNKELGENTVMTQLLTFYSFDHLYIFKKQ